MDSEIRHPLEDLRALARELAITTDILTTRQAAARLGVGVRRVRYLIARGQLAAERLGRDWMIQAATLGQLQEQRHATRRLPRRAGRPPKTGQEDER